MSLKTVKDELKALAVSFSNISSKTNTVVNTIATVSTPMVENVIEPSVKLQYLIENNTQFIEKANEDFREELEIILLDYSNEISDYIENAYEVVGLLGDVISDAIDIAICYEISVIEGTECPLSAEDLEPYIDELQEFSTLCKGLAEESRKWDDDLVEGDI